jgi:hypothetical protein
MAYSLLGIFNVHMSPIYGEGDQAFIRLQQEIIKTSDDESIFAWSKSGPVGAFDGLAPAPSMFGSDREIVPLGSSGSREPFSMTNKGLYIYLRLWKDVGSSSYWGILNCRFQYSFDGKVAIPLLMSTNTSGVAVLNRETYTQPRFVTNSEALTANYVPIYIRHNSDYISKQLIRFLCIVISNMSLRALRYDVSVPDANKGSSFWYPTSQISEVIYIGHYNHTIVNFLFNRDNESSFIITVVGDFRRAGFHIEIKPEKDDCSTWSREICDTSNRTWTEGDKDNFEFFDRQDIAIGSFPTGMKRLRVVLRRNDRMGSKMWSLEVSAGSKRELTDRPWNEFP